MNYKISVVIPTYNYDRFVTQAIDSVLVQTYDNYEVIVIDDGSSDRTVEILQSYGDKIRYVTQTNQGLAASRNRGLELARGELVIFLDADDWFFPQMLAEAAAVFAQQPELGIVVSGWRNVDEMGATIADVQPWLSLPELNINNWVVWRPLLPSATLFRRSWLEAVGGFDGATFPAEDIDCVLRMVARGCRSAWCPQVGVCYRLHEGNITRDTVRQAQAFEQLCDRFFAREDLSWSVRALENQTRFYCLLWSAWRLYTTGCGRQMLAYLAKTLPYSPHFPAETIARWGKYLTQNCRDFLNTKFDVYHFSSLPGWQELTTLALEQIQPTVSVIIAVDHAAESLSDAIASILAQTYRHYEIIVLDAATDDSSADSVQSILDSYKSSIRYFKHNCQGISAAYNRAIHLARGEFVVFFKANDLLLPNILKAQLEVLQASAKTGMTISGWQTSNPSAQITSTVEPWSFSSEDLISLLHHQPFNLSATMFRRQWLARVEGFNSELVGAEDTDLCLRLIGLGCPVAFTPIIGAECPQLDPMSHNAEAWQIIHQRLFGLSLPLKIRLLENSIRFQALVWSAWCFYQAGDSRQMLAYLRQSQGFMTTSGAEAIAQWLHHFIQHSQLSNQPCDAYGLTQTPGWQELIAETLGIHPARVSVIIPVYNNSQYLLQAINSVLEQTYTDYEIIVVNDGSTDDIATVIAPCLDQIRYVTQANQGVSVARNRGLYLARGELIAFLDADDIFLPDKLQQQVAVFDAQPQVGIVNSGFEVINADGKAIAQVRWWQDVPELTPTAWVLYKPILPSAMMFRKSWLMRAGGFDPHFFAGEDIYLTLGIIAQGCPAAWLTEITVQYRRHPQSVTLANPLKQLRNTELMLKTFFNRQDLPESIQNLANKSRFSTYVWIASRCYQFGLYPEMAAYLRKSQQYSNYSWVQLTEQWVRTFHNSIEGFGNDFDPYVLSNLPEWQDLIAAQLV